MAKRYSVYDRRTDQPVIIYATARERAAAMGLTEMSFYSVYSRQKNNGKVSMKWEIFEDEKEENDHENMDEKNCKSGERGI